MDVWERKHAAVRIQPGLCSNRNLYPSYIYCHLGSIGQTYTNVPNKKKRMFLNLASYRIALMIRNFMQFMKPTR